MKVLFIFHSALEITFGLLSRDCFTAAFRYQRIDGHTRSVYLMVSVVIQLVSCGLKTLKTHYQLPAKSTALFC